MAGTLKAARGLADEVWPADPSFAGLRSWMIRWRPNVECAQLISPEILRANPRLRRQSRLE